MSHLDPMHIPVGSSTLMQPMAPPAMYDTDISTSARDPSTIHLNTSNLATSLSSSMITTMKEQGYTTGMIRSLWDTRKTFPLRIWLVDNSGSMRITDGTRTVSNGGEIKVVKGCSRWAEMQECVESHARISACLEMPIVFRLLNDPGVECGPQQFSIALNGSASVSSDLDIALQTMRKSTPGGITPLVEHMEYIRQNILGLENQLRQAGTKVCITIATDGLPSDSEGLSTHDVSKQFETKLKSMEGLPVWIVIRLFTNDEAVVKFWNELDSKIELSIEVLDDLSSEAVELYENNKWLNYGMPLHRMREFGFKHYVLDLIDEKKLSKDELRQFCKILFGHTEIDEAPDASVDWKGFCTVLARVNKDEKKQWNTIRSRMEPWIDMNALKRVYGDTKNKGCTIS